MGVVRRSVNLDRQPIEEAQEPRGLGLVDPTTSLGDQQHIDHLELPEHWDHGGVLLEPIKDRIARVC
jgi:hypothetical protein